jgi:hypothetical protein
MVSTSYTILAAVVYSVSWYLISPPAKKSIFPGRPGYLLRRQLLCGSCFAGNVSGVPGVRLGSLGLPALPPSPRLHVVPVEVLRGEPTVAPVWRPWLQPFDK